MIASTMSQTDIYIFAESIRRIFLFIVTWFKFTKNFLLKKQLPVLTKVETVNPIQKYIEPLKTKFLQTFQEEEEDILPTRSLRKLSGAALIESSKYNWNSNVNEAMRDKEQFAELMRSPNNELERIWRTRVLIETTPRGNVIMFYDAYKRAFSYYCDQAVMPYEIMNAVAMKYVMTFHCRDFFMDSNVLPSSQKTPLPIVSDKQENDNGISTSIQKTAKLDKTAFAKFKTYNNATKKVGISQEDDKTINCFLHLGASRNWCPIAKKVKPNPINGFKTDLVPGSNNNNKMSYLEFKNIQKKNQ